MSFAEGFAQGYGLMDATLRAKQESEDRKEEAAKRDEQFNKTLGLHTATLQETKDQNLRQEALRNKELTLKNENEDEDRKIAKQNADSMEQSRKDNAAHQRAMVGLQAQQNAISAMNARSMMNLHQIQAQAAQLEINQAQKKQQIAEAKQRLIANYVDPATSTLNVPKDKNSFESMADDLKTAYGADVYQIAKNADKFHNATSVLKDTFDHYQGGEITDKTNPSAIKSLNLLLGNRINTGLGDSVKGRVLSKEIHSIIPHQGTPSADNPSGMMFSIGLKVKTKGHDGKIYDTIEPMTQFRSMDSEADPNVRAFTPQQLFNELNGHSALVDTIITNPDIMSRVNGVVSNDLKPAAKKADYIKAENPVFDNDGKPLLDQNGKPITEDVLIDQNNPNNVFKVRDAIDTNQILGNISAGLSSLNQPQKTPLPQPSPDQPTQPSAEQIKAEQEKRALKNIGL